MPSILIRDLPNSAAERLDMLAAQAKQSRQEYLYNLIIEHVGGEDGSPVVGYFPLSRRGSESLECGSCNKEIDGLPWYGVRADKTLTGPLCSFCAEE